MIIIYSVCTKDRIKALRAQSSKFRIDVNHSVLIFGLKLKQSRVDALEDTSLGKLLKLKDVFDARKLTVTSKLYTSDTSFGLQTLGS